MLFDSSRPGFTTSSTFHVHFSLFFDISHPISTSYSTFDTPFHSYSTFHSAGGIAQKVPKQKVNEEPVAKLLFVLRDKGFVDQPQIVIRHFPPFFTTYFRFSADISRPFSTVFDISHPISTSHSTCHTPFPREVILMQSNSSTVLPATRRSLSLKWPVGTYALP